MLVFLKIFFSRLAQETSKEDVKNRESVYILLDLIVNASPFLSMDLLESCFPYTLLRNSYHNVHKLSYNALATTTNAAWDENLDVILAKKNKILKYYYYAYWVCEYTCFSYLWNSRLYLLIYIGVVKFLFPFLFHAANVNISFNGRYTIKHMISFVLIKNHQNMTPGIFWKRS